MTRVVKPDELGKPDERLTEQMRKLELSPQEGEDTLTLLHCHTCTMILKVLLYVIRFHYLPTGTVGGHQNQSTATDGATVHKDTTSPTHTVSNNVNDIATLMSVDRNSILTPSL